MTPLKKPKIASTPTPETYHVRTDEPYESDEESLEYERESTLFEMWKKDQLVQLKHEIKALETKKRCLECRQFPDMDDWLRNKQFIVAAEKGRMKYSNDDFTRTEMANQMLARELKRTLEAAHGTAGEHPVHKMLRMDCIAK